MSWPREVQLDALALEGGRTRGRAGKKRRTRLDLGGRNQPLSPQLLGRRCLHLIWTLAGKGFRLVWTRRGPLIQLSLWPEAFSLAKLIQHYLDARHDVRKVVPDFGARYFGALLDDGSHAL